MLTKLFVAALAVASCVEGLVKVPLIKKEILQPEYIDTNYVGQVGIGSVESFQLLFDTSSYVPVVTNFSCLSETCNCVGMQKYYPTSTTRDGPNDAEKSVAILDNYQVIGKEVFDSIKIGNLTTAQQGIVVADEIPQILCTLRADGVIGMGRPNSGNAPFGIKTVFENFISQGEIKPIFTFHHARYPNGEHFGELTLGGVNPRYYSGEIQRVPLVDDSTWNFNLDSIKVGNEEVVAKSLGMIDSSKAIVVGPAEGIDKINEKLGCKNTKIKSAEICQFDCNKLQNIPDVTFMIGGISRNISAEYHVQQQGTICYSGFTRCKATVYLIGDFFIDHYIPIYDAGEKTMGFAKSTGSI